MWKVYNYLTLNTINYDFSDVYYSPQSAPPPTSTNRQKLIQNVTFLVLRNYFYIIQMVCHSSSRAIANHDAYSRHLGVTLG